MILKRTTHTGNPTVLFKVSKNFDLTLSAQWEPKLLGLLQEWWRWLGTCCDGVTGENEHFQKLITKFLSLWCSEGYSGM